MAITVTQDLMHALVRDQCPSPGWQTASEVQVPHPDGLRFIDAVALQVHNTQHEAHGFELKVSRGDWLHEMKHPDKSAPGRELVDRWWLVAGSPMVYNVDEVPPTWGILCPDSTGRLRVVREAKRLRPRTQPPSPWPRAFIAAFMGRQGDGATAHTRVLSKAQRDAETRGYRKGIQAAKRKQVLVAGASRPKYDPGRYNLDDGAPLDLP